MILSLTSTKRILMSTTLLAASLLATPAKAAEPVASGMKMDSVQIVVKDGQKMLSVCMSVTLENGRGRPCVMVATVYDRNGQPVTTADGTALTARLTMDCPLDGPVAHSGEFFFPMEQLEAALGSGGRQPSIMVNVYDSQGKKWLLGQSLQVDVNLVKPAPPNKPATSAAPLVGTWRLSVTTGEIGGEDVNVEITAVDAKGNFTFTVPFHGQGVGSYNAATGEIAFSHEGMAFTGKVTKTSNGGWYMGGFCNTSDKYHMDFGGYRSK